jgi:FixJ family two-component response regulator
MWSALLEGRLTLVDWFDEDGRRVVVARRNEQVAQRLSAVERTVVTSVARGRAQKVVACELGLSAAAVSDALARAIGKLGLSSVAELTRVAAALGVAR